MPFDTNKEPAIREAFRLKKPAGCGNSRDLQVRRLGARRWSPQPEDMAYWFAGLLLLSFQWHERSDSIAGAPKLVQMPGRETKILTGLHGENMMMVLNATLPGHTVPTHSHPHEQIGMVYDGKAEII